MSRPIRVDSEVYARAAQVRAQLVHEGDRNASLNDALRVVLKLDRKRPGFLMRLHDHRAGVR